MKFPAIALMMLDLQVVDAFMTPSSSMAGRHRAFVLKATNSNNNDANLQEFDFLLGEGGEFAQNAAASVTNTRRRHVVLDSKGDATEIQLVSSMAIDAPEAGAATTEFNVDAELDGLSDDLSSMDVDNDLDFGLSEIKGAPPGPKGKETLLREEAYKRSHMQKIQQQQQGGGLANSLKDWELGDMIKLFVLPSIIVFWVGKNLFNKASTAYEGKAEEILDSYANEMIYHDGDFDEMKLCHSDYVKRLLMLGPRQKEIMLRHFLNDYAKKKPVSPQAISSLAYVFSMYKLSEEKAAKILVETCKEAGAGRSASTGKLYFMGSRILKSAEGKAALAPIREIIASSYGDGDQAMADGFIDASQTSMGEAAYKTSVQEGGPDQKSLTIGWEVLGLDRETAERIFNEELKEGFKKDRDRMYEGQVREYDKDGNRLNKDGSFADPDNIIESEDDGDDAGPTSGAFECGECGFTLFVAEGRESKFFGPGFKCPECGAAKDKFTARDDFGEDDEE